MSCTAADLINIQPLALSDTFNTWFDRTNEIIDSTNAINVYEVDVGPTQGGLIKETGCSAGYYNGVVTLSVNPGAGIGIGTQAFTNNYNKVVIDAIRLEDLGGGTSTNPASDDYFIVSDISDTRQSPAGTPKRVIARRILPSNIDGDIEFTGNITINGDFNVAGDTTYLDSNNLRIEDKLIELAYQRYVEFMVQSTTSSLTAGTFVYGMTAFYADTGNPVTAGPATTVGTVIGWSFTGSSPGTTGIIQIGSFSDEGGADDFIVGGKVVVTGAPFTGILTVTGASGVGIGEQFLSDTELQPAGLWVRGEESDKFLTWVCSSDCGASPANWNAWVSNKNLGVTGSDNWILSSKFASYGYCDSSVNNSFTYIGANNAFTRYDVGTTLTMRHSPTGQAGITFGIVYTGSTGPATYPGITTTNWVKHFNADQLDGAHAVTGATAWHIPIALDDGRIHEDWVRADSVRKKFYQPGHGFRRGHVVRFDSNGSLTFAQANTIPNAEALGLVDGISGAWVDVVSQGYMKNITATGGFANLIPLTTGQAYFLHPDVRGLLASNVDSGALSLTAGEVRKAMFLANSSNSGYVFDYTGIVVGETPTDYVYMKEVAPVGAIQPFAGTTAGIPYGWLLCDGSVLDQNISHELYQAIQQTHHAKAIVDGEDAILIEADTRGLTAGDALRLTWGASESANVLVSSVDSSTRTVTLASSPFATVTEGTAVKVFGRTVGSTVGRSVFFLPDLRRRTVFGTSVGDGLRGSINDPAISVGSVGGEDDVTLSESNIPDHSHILSTNVAPQANSGIYASAETAARTGLIDVSENSATPFAIMPPYIGMHWIIRSKIGLSATILTGHNHDLNYIRYDIYHSITGGAANNLTDADRARFRVNAKVLRNDGDDTMRGTLSITGNLGVSGSVVIQGLGNGTTADLTVPSIYASEGISSGYVIANIGNFRQSLTVTGPMTNNLSGTQAFMVTGGTGTKAIVRPALNAGLSAAGQYNTGSISANSRNVVIDRITGEVSVKPLYLVSTTGPSNTTNPPANYPEGFVWYRTGNPSETSSPGPKFIEPVVVFNLSSPPSSSGNMITIPSSVPTSATALILETTVSINSPDNTATVSTFSASTTSNGTRYNFAGARSAGSNDQSGACMQGTIPFDTVNRRFYWHLNLNIIGSATCRIIGYY
jgi:microcystin-dependent protein